MSWRCLEDMSSGPLQDISSRRHRDIFSVTNLRLSRRLAKCLQDVLTHLEDVFSVTDFCRPSSLQDVFRDVFKTSLQVVIKTFSSRLQDVMETGKLLRWRRVEEVFKTCLEEIFKTSSRLINASWDVLDFLNEETEIFTSRYRQNLVNIRSPEYKNIDNLSEFKNKIKNWVPQNCPCRLCKTYIHQVGFI